MAMTKQELINQVSREAELTKKDSKNAVDAVFKSITESLEKGEKVNFVGFGSFEVRDRVARTGRNPQTGEEIEIPARKIPAFKPGKLLREAVK